MNSMKMVVAKAGALAVTLTPMVVLAQLEFEEFNTTASNITGFINNTLIPLVFAVALLVFIWGMFRFFVMGGHNDDAKKQGKSLMIWATVGFVLMVSIFGIVNLIAGGLGFSDDQEIQNIPNAPTENT